MHRALLLPFIFLFIEKGKVQANRCSRRVGEQREELQQQEGVLRQTDSLAALGKERNREDSYI